MAERGLAFCIDECLGVKIAPMLRELRAPGSPFIHRVQELNLSGTKDEVLFGELHKRNFRAMITKDSAILSASIRRDARKATNLSLFVLHGNWGNLNLFEQACRLFWWWPLIVLETGREQQQSAWTVKRETSGSLERRL